MVQKGLAQLILLRNLAVRYRRADEWGAGDTFIQNGTNHQWYNRGDVPALVAVVLIGGKPRL
jgi:hypothetical protein